MLNGMVCKGCYALGTACGNCARCDVDPMRPGATMEDRQVLKEVKSGKIELVYNGVYSTLQFNCHCLDALPFCKAMCCRQRQGFTVILTQKEAEAKKYKTKQHPQSKGVQVLQADPTGQFCVYLDNDKNTCSIHEDSPWMCGAYHCSPGGLGDRVKHRDGGWLWTPINALQQLADGSVIDIRNQSKKVSGSVPIDKK